MTPREALFLSLGALAYPAGKLLGHLIFHTSVIYPEENP